MLKNDFIYYNGSSLCQKINPDDPDIQATFYDQRPSAMIEDATNWKCAIERFSVSSRTLPVWIPKMKNLSLSASETAYQVQFNINTITANSNTAHNISSQPISLFYNCVSKYSNSSETDINSQYFYVYNISQFVDMLNQALNTAFTNLQSTLNQQGEFESVTLLTKCPKVYFSNNLFTFAFDSYGFGGVDNTSNSQAQQEDISLFINEDLKNLLVNLNLIYYQNNTPLLPYEISVSNRILNILNIGQIQYYTETQNYESTSCVFSPVQSIVFSSNIGLMCEYTGNTNILNSNSNNFVSSTAIENNITDISLSLDTCQDYNSLISFVPSHLRYCDILTNEIRDINIKIFWKHINGTNLPLLMSDNCYMNIKIGFYRK